MTIKDLKPAIVWKYFEILCQIPRPSKKEEKVIEYLLSFAKEHKLEAKKDKAGNVLITKPAIKGKEKLATLILQGHVDMVAEKNSGTKHDFDKDPIKTIVDGDWLRADGTTLGADNGLGVAAILAILASDDIKHGKIEALFTVDEETGLTGAYALTKNFLTGDILLNLDTEAEGELYIGCAGGKGTKAIFTYKEEKTPAGYFWFKATVSGLSGGHSGSEIHKGLGNANKVLNRYLWALKQKHEVRLAEIAGGNLHNAIPREAYAIIGIPAGAKEDASAILNTLLALIREELKTVDAKLSLSISSHDAPSKIIDKKTSDNLTHAVYGHPHGVMGMSHEIEGLVETSTNLASIKMEDNNTIVVGSSQRSSTESLKDDVANKINAIFTLAGARVVHTDGYPGWKPNTNSAILKIAQKVYKDMYNLVPKVKAIHAGLECGLFLEKYPHLDMLSCGPSINDAHSPDEKVKISSVEKWWPFVVKLVESVPNK